jgi:phosphatidylserine/phosphatidylglycerophosphate/cardiolipin synthase-like enzyme
MLLYECAQGFTASWPGTRLPEVFYDPRGLSTDPEKRASWHAKCVVIDDAVSLVTSANFTEWAQERNVEAGALIRSPHFARQLRGQFDALVQSGLVVRLSLPWKGGTQPR